MNGTFVHNAGGGLAIEDTGAATITKCWFIFNSAGYSSPNGASEGAGFASIAVRELKILDSEFWFNTAHGASSTGGGVIIVESRLVDMVQCGFNHNKAAFGGAALVTPAGGSTRFDVGHNYVLPFCHPHNPKEQMLRMHQSISTKLVSRQIVVFHTHFLDILLFFVRRWCLILIE